MKLVLRDYPEETILEVQQEYDPKALDLEFVDLKYDGPLRLEGEVLKSSESVHFWGHLKAPVSRICGRCLLPVQESVDEPFDLYYEIKGLEEIETLDDLREFLIVGHPAQFLCKEDCKGLCSQCGVNLNEKTCGCKAPETFSEPLAKLGELFKKKDKSQK